MTRYKNLSGRAGIIAYAIYDDWIDVTFADGTVYRYSDIKPGIHHVERMKELAEEGEGLTTYINQNVRENYERKLK
jgi:hypothetical protein